MMLLVCSAMDLRARINERRSYLRWRTSLASKPHSLSPNRRALTTPKASAVPVQGMIREFTFPPRVRGLRASPGTWESAIPCGATDRRRCLCTTDPVVYLDRRRVMEEGESKFLTADDYSTCARTRIASPPEKDPAFSRRQPFMQRGQIS